MISLSKKHLGFTLIEVLIVIAIIGIFAAFVIYNGEGARKTARDTERIDVMRELSLAFEAYEVQYGRQPNCRNYLKIDGALTNGSGHAGGCVDLAQITDFFNSYFGEIPVDPLGPNNNEHFYAYDSAHSCGDTSPGYENRSKAIVFAKLELEDFSNSEEVCPRNTVDPCAANDGQYNCYADGEHTIPYVIPLSAINND